MTKTTPVVTSIRETPVVTGASSAIPIPARSSNRGPKSAYDFSVLGEIGASFGVVNKTVKQVNPVVFKENRRNCVETPDPTTPGKTIKTYNKRYEVFAVDPKTDPDGAQVRVFRVA